MKRVLPILVLALAIPALVNCKKEEKDEPTPPPPVKVETISVNPDKIEINDGDTRNLSVAHVQNPAFEKLKKLSYLS